MKTITIINAASAKLEQEYMNPNELVIKGDNNMDASDGYHTFTELYDHRHVNFIALCKQLNRMYIAPVKKGEQGIKMYDLWRSKLHSDGSSFDGWFILGIHKEEGKQITYHFPIAYWDETNFAETLDRAPEWDGHTSADVLQRLKKL